MPIIQKKRGKIKLIKHSRKNSISLRSPVKDTKKNKMKLNTSLFTIQWLSIWPESVTYHSLLSRVQTIKKIKCHGIFYVTQFYTLLFPQHYLLPSSLNYHKPGYKVKKKKKMLQHLLYQLAAFTFHSCCNICNDMVLYPITNFYSTMGCHAILFPFSRVSKI